MRLLGRRNNAVSEIALRIVASMKRDWMQTCRKPSGLCGAALYIFALSHGFNYSKSDIVTVVHICEATLTKRLIEFEDTESGCLKDVQQTDLSSKLTLDSTGCAAPASKEPKLNGRSSVDTFACNDPEQDLHEEGTGNAESFSDIDDVEVDGYLHDEEEKKYKNIICEEMKKEYLEEQAAKEAAASEAAKEAYEATLSNNSEEFRSAQELAAATAAALANSKKDVIDGELYEQIPNPSS